MLNSATTEKRTNLIIATGRIFRHSFLEMRRHDPLRMAGATSFFTSFALAPILIILFQLFSLFLSRKLVGSQMMEMLSRTLGEDGAQQVRATTRGFRTLAQNWYTAAAGFLFLIFVSTTLFNVIKSTLNEIWEVRPYKASILRSLKLRAKSLAVILVAGILFLSGIMLDTFEVIAGNSIKKIWPDGGAFFQGALNEVVGAVIVVLWFIILFRYLADARPAWKVAIVGGIVTGILFSLGKLVLAVLLRGSNIGAIYGASGSIVLLLLFVFYSSFILYFGASFIKVYAESIARPIKPVGHAYKYQMQKID